MDVKASKDTETCVVFGDSTVASEIPRLLAAKLRANGINNVSVPRKPSRATALLPTVLATLQSCSAERALTVSLRMFSDRQA